MRVAPADDRPSGGARRAAALNGCNSIPWVARRMAGTFTHDFKLPAYGAEL